ncbi:MAG: bifunctional serine/threonine-protein kinase/formylglycine-generating enzyme family protein [Candidatus Competibacter sp.]
MAEPSTVECPGCFQKKASEGATCPQCGHNPGASRSLSIFLPVQTQLKRYVIGEKLGKGGFGITYRGFDLKLRMRVAIKEYYPNDFVSRDANDRKTVMLISPENESLFQYALKAFINEAQTLAQLQHPNLVRVLNRFEMNGKACLVMDYYEGETLHDHLDRQPDKKLPWRQAVNLLLPALDGLAEVHRSGFMHRDVKPRNLYLTQRGQLILLDFGAARQVVGDRTRTYATYSKGYGAYEQYVQDKQGPWTDVYGAAATLYFALTGKAPPPAPERMKKDRRKPARHFSLDLPPALDNVLDRALAVEPKKRLQTIEEFEQQLRAILKQEEKNKPRIPRTKEWPEWLKNPRLKAMLEALLAAVAVAGLIGVAIWPPAPPYDPTRAYLTIKTEPAGAVVHIRNGTLEDIPYRDRLELSPSKYYLDVSAPGYQSHRDWHAVAAGSQDLKIKLVPAQLVEPPPPTATIPPPPTESESPSTEQAPAPNLNPERTYLTVKAEPPEAKVRIMNIDLAYADGIELLPGEFDIEVSASGYRIYRQKHDLVAGPQEVRVTLQAEPQRLPFEPEMVQIAGGCFQMGSPETEKGRDDDERQHEVCVGIFEIGVYEVTQGQWKAVMGGNPSYFKNGDDKYPVESVSWNDVQTYLGKLNQKTGKNYRLPTEAEWEYAARAGTTGPFWTGRCVTTEQANYDGNYGYGEPGCGARIGAYRWKTLPVGSFKPNLWGLYDTMGNVWEWTCSAYDEKYGSAEQKCTEKNITGPLAVRGGSWFDVPAGVRSANRYGFAPAEDRSDRLGFRLARSL